eukprot:jgi/Astpho2/461/Aster-03506
MANLEVPSEDQIHELDRLAPSRRRQNPHIERTSFDEKRPLPEELGDGYTGSGQYFKAFSSDAKSRHPERNSAGDLVALGEAEAARVNHVQRPASIDLKPNRSEGGQEPTGDMEPQSASGTRQYQPRTTEDDGYKPSSYYATKRRSVDMRRE